MRILILHLHEKQYQLGGADRGVLDLAIALKNQKGHEIHILANQGPFAEEAARRGLTIQPIPSARWAFLKTIRLIEKEIQFFRPEIVHSHHRFTTFLLDLFFKGKGFPILHTQRVQSWDKRILFRYGDFVTTVSESLSQHMIAYYHVPKDRIKTVVNAVSLKAPEAKEVEGLRKKFSRQPGESFALCAGRFHPQKGHIYLIQALEKMEPSYRNRIRIFLLGDGPLEEDLKRQITEKNLTRNFVFAGYVEEMSEYLEFCDFVVLPSLWEGLPRVILEAFIMGRPAIATDIPGTSDVLESQKNGLLVPPRNAEALSKGICRFLDHPEEVSRMREAARKSAEKYSFEKMVANYHDLYQTLIRNQR